MKDGGSAYPVLEYEDRTCESCVQIAHYTTGGMTLRDYFAGQALVAVADHCRPGSDYEAMAKHVYQLADAMLAEREKGK